MKYVTVTKDAMQQKKTRQNKLEQRDTTSCAKFLITEYSTTKCSHRLKVHNSQTMSINQYFNHFEISIQDVHQVNVQDHLK